MVKYIFWNNKGGTGKTSLAFQVICEYAFKHPESQILAIDVCPQANLSELMLGGLHKGGSENLLKVQGGSVRSTIGGYFQLRLPFPYSAPVFNASDYITSPRSYNQNIPDNIDLLCGDPLLELQANAISTLANNQIPGTDTWVAIIDWLKDFIVEVNDYYDIIFIDANPSFSMYTQIAISIADRIVLPVMADDSSRRAIQNAFSLIYGLKLPSEIYTRYAFAEKLKFAERTLPQVHLIIKNRITQYMLSPASAYATVLSCIDNDIEQLQKKNANIFTFTNVNDGVAVARDFQTAGVVAFARGCPFRGLQAGRLDLLGQRVQVKEEYRMNCLNEIESIVKRLE